MVDNLNTHVFTTISESQYNCTQIELKQIQNAIETFQLNLFGSWMLCTSKHFLTTMIVAVRNKVSLLDYLSLKLALLSLKLAFMRLKLAFLRLKLALLSLKLAVWNLKLALWSLKSCLSLKSAYLGQESAHLSLKLAPLSLQSAH